MKTYTQKEFEQLYGKVGVETATKAAQPKEKKPNYFSRVGSQFNQARESISNDLKTSTIDNAPIKALNVVGDFAKSVFAPVTELFSPTIEKGINKLSDQSFIQKSAMTGPGADVLKVADRVKVFADKHPELANATEDLYNIANVLVGAKVNTKVSPKGAISTIDDATERFRPKPTTGPTGPSTISKFREKGAKMMDKFSQPNVSDATRVSLNPVEALKNTSQEFKVSVGGTLKDIKDITLNENSKLKMSTLKSIEKFTKEAEKFKNTRNPLNDPTEIVGQRVDKALTFADAKRQTIGQKMGEIEQKYVAEPLDISEKTLKSFIDIANELDNSRYGMNTGGKDVVQTLIKNFDELNNKGATIGERLDFVRKWDEYLNDAKDPFGNFKENANIHRQVQNAVRTLKNETLDEISKVDRDYRKLRTNYSMYKKLDEIGNSLLGKDGLLGDRVKGGATVKRALKSNSDAGARQFLIKLKELTGYDAIRDGDLALTAMQNVGDFQGLSLLEVIKQGKSGIINKILDKATTKLVGDDATRVKKYIKR